MAAMHTLPIAIFAATLSLPFASAQDATRTMDKTKLAEPKVIAGTMRNFMPYQWTLERELKELIYGALE